MEIGYAVILAYDILSLVMWKLRWYKVVTVIRGVAMATEAYMVYYISLKDLVTLVTTARFDLTVGVYVGIRLLAMLWLWPSLIKTEFIVFKRLGTLTVNDVFNVFEALKYEAYSF